MLYFDPVTCYLHGDNENADIRYNMNYKKILEWSWENSSP
jgi:hypothetical protein